MKLTLLLFSCLALSIVTADADEDADPKYIESKSYEYYLKIGNTAVTKQCKVNEMAAYGLVADATSLSEPNPICPQMQGNCCGKHAQELINQYWLVDDRHQSSYHATFLKINRYILGNAKEYLSIASDIIEKSKKLKLNGQDKNPQGNGGQSTPSAQPTDNEKLYTFDYHPVCAKAAEEFLHLDFVDRNKAQGFYDLLNRKAEFMQNARRGFYCSLCNPKAKDYIWTFRMIIDSRLFYNKEFCQVIYGQTFAPIYKIYKAYNPFLKSLLKMLSCIKPRGAAGAPQSGAGQGAQNQNEGLQTNGQVNLSFNPVAINMNFGVKNPFAQLSKEAKKLFENPLNIKSRLWMEICYNADPTGLFFSMKCMGFCENFRMTKASKLMDGDLDAINTVYEQLVMYEFALSSTFTNIFNDDVLQLKNEIVVQMQSLKHNYNFYRSLAPKMDFSKYKTVFSLFIDGYNPMALSKGTTLTFKYRAVNILRILIVAILSLVWIK